MVNDYKGYIDELELDEALVFCLLVAAQWLDQATTAALELKEYSFVRATSELKISTLQLKDLVAAKYGNEVML